MIKRLPLNHNKFVFIIFIMISHPFHLSNPIMSVFLKTSSSSRKVILFELGYSHTFFYISSNSSLIFYFLKNFDKASNILSKSLPSYLLHTPVKMQIILFRAVCDLLLQFMFFSLTFTKFKLSLYYVISK